MQSSWGEEGGGTGEEGEDKERGEVGEQGEREEGGGGGRGEEEGRGRGEEGEDKERRKRNRGKGRRERGREKTVGGDEERTEGNCRPDCISTALSERKALTGDRGGNTKNPVSSGNADCRLTDTELQTATGIKPKHKYTVRLYSVPRETSSSTIPIAPLMKHLQGSALNTYQNKTTLLTGALNTLTQTLSKTFHLTLPPTCPGPATPPLLSMTLLLLTGPQSPSSTACWNSPLF